MQQIQGEWAIIGVLGMVLFIVVIGKKIQMLLNFMIRIVLGGIGIIYANDFFTSQGIAISVGLNPVDRKSTRLNSSHGDESRMPSSA